MDTDAIQLVLNELRSFRSDLQAWQFDLGERVSSLETQMKTGVTGNGQPSRLQSAESAIEELQRSHWSHTGFAAGIGAVFGAAVHFLMPFFLPGGRH